MDLFPVYTLPSDLYSQAFSKTPTTYEQIGRGLTPFIGRKYQKGYGFGNILGFLFRSITPFIRPTIKKAVASLQPLLKKAKKQL